MKKNFTSFVCTLTLSTAQTLLGKQKFVYFNESAPQQGSRPEAVEANQEAPGAKLDMTKKEDREKLYKDVETEIRKLRTNSDEKSLRSAASLERTLDMARKDEHPELGESDDTPDKTAGRLFDRLQSITHPKAAPGMPEGQVNILSNLPKARPEDTALEAKADQQRPVEKPRPAQGKMSDARAKILSASISKADADMLAALGNKPIEQPKPPVKKPDATS